MTTLTQEMGDGHWPAKGSVTPFLVFTDKEAAIRMRDRAARELADALDKAPDDKPLLSERLCVYRWLQRIVDE